MLSGASARRVEAGSARRLGALWPSVYFMLMSSRLPGSRWFCTPSRPAAEHRGGQQIGLGGAVGEAELELPGIGDADHVGAVVAGVGHRVERPGGAGDGARRIDALVRSSPSGW